MMSVRFYNTLTRRKEDFSPLQVGKAGIYVCGITAYDLCHIGHARAAIVFDVLARFLRYRGYDVTYVKNFTDVDDKIIARAEREGRTIGEVAETFIAAHDEDMAALGVERATVTPRATEHIDGMIALIRTLLEKGLAYVVSGDVYYAVERFAGYGKLSGRGLEEMLAGARIDVNEKKTNPMDFALWKGSKPGEPGWDSPWGKGRPGWHIECSVMSQRYLGDTFDIHGGGEDLIFPHHENEIAQSEGATGRPLARVWMHNGFVRVNKEKMSKSLGNFSTIREMLAVHPPEVLRLFILQSHYRSPVDFSDQALRETRTGLDRFYETRRKIQAALSGGPAADGTAGERLTGGHRRLYEKATGLQERFAGAMDDDLNTARAIGYIFDGVRQVNAYLDAEGQAASPERTLVLAAARQAFDRCGDVLGLFRQDPRDYFAMDQRRETGRRGLEVAEIEDLIAQRLTARQARNWAQADAIRQRLAEHGVILQDGPAATTWKFA
ncbi:MAG TPA: cysteine--tRNA ligase [Syntrophales bacterium]|nr:cysteine--tRNA ligase [Syntrophales bacterium]